MNQQQQLGNTKTIKIKRRVKWGRHLENKNGLFIINTDRLGVQFIPWTLQKATHWKAASQLLPFFHKTRMNLLIQQLSDLFCYGIALTRSTNSTHVCQRQQFVSMHGQTWRFLTNLINSSSACSEHRGAQGIGGICG